MDKDSKILYNPQVTKSYAERYLLRGWNIVPVVWGEKKPITEWHQYIDKAQTLAYLETIDWSKPTNIAIVCGRHQSDKNSFGPAYKLVVIDCDSQETVEWYEREFPQFVDTYKVKTRRGIHYYYIVQYNTHTDKIPTITSYQYKFDCKGVYVELDIRGEKALAMAPPSVYIWTDEKTQEQKSHQYTELNEIDSIMTVEYASFAPVLSYISQCYNEYLQKQAKLKDDKEEGIDVETVETQGISKYRIKEDALISFLKEIYTEGQRNTVIMYASGFLRKAGYSLDEAEEFFKKFFETVDDEEEKARFATIRHTYKKEDVSQLKGYAGLVELCAEDETLKDKLRASFYRKKFWSDGDIWVNNWTVYAVERYKKDDGAWETKNVEVGPAFRVVKRLIENDTIKYLIETQFTQAIATTDEITKVATNASGSLILKQKKWKEFANKSFREQFYRFPTVLSMVQTGWQKKRLILNGKERKLFFFAHPALKYNDIEFEMADGHLLARHTEPKMDVEYERFVVNALADGKLLGLLYLFAFSSVLIELMGEHAFTVILSGESGAGKTTLASLACSLFYPASEELITANATAVGIELAMKSLKNLPILIDEGALRKINLQDIVFMVSAGKGKLRGTQHLTINLSKFSSVMFYTSESSELSELTRGGAFRRLVYIPIRRGDNIISDIYSMDDLVSMRKYWGLGLDYIKRIQYEYENQTELWNEALRYGEEKAIKYQGFSWLKVVYATLYLLEKILEIRLTRDDVWMLDWTLESMLESVMKRSLERFNEESNTINKFTKLLSAYITQNLHKFIDLNNSSSPNESDAISREIIGYREDNHIGILCNVFEKFCDDAGFNVDVILGEFDKMSILKKLEQSDRRKTRKRINGIRSEYYVFDALKLGFALDVDGTNEKEKEFIAKLPD